MLLQPKTRAARILGAVAASFLVLGIGSWVVYTQLDTRDTTPTPSPAPITGEQITVEGKLACLPHRDTSGPVTLECAYGLQLDSGGYYALDTLVLQSGELFSMPTGTRITATGTLIARDTDADTTWKTYAIEGLLRVASVTPR